jgi:hypothetical protein
MVSFGISTHRIADAVNGGIREAKYCSGACNQAAYRERTRGDVARKGP